MGSSKRKSRQMSDEEPEEPPTFAVRSILDENKTKYLVDWADIDGESFPPSWEPKNFVTSDLIPEWEQLKEQRKKEKRKSTASRPSTGKAVQLDDDDEEDNDDEDEESSTASGSGSASAMKPSITLKISKQKPVVEVTPPAARVSEPTKKGQGRPRKSIQSGEGPVASAPKTYEDKNQQT
jgi:hypothetical protein